MFNNDFIVSKNESNAIKGLLILLIILGHNYMLSNLYFNEKIFGWLYSFHVSMFFIIPFFYNIKKNDKSVKQKFIDGLKRIYIPYLWFYVIAFLLYSYYTSQLDFISFIKGLFPINSLLIKNAVGVNFLWFPPCFIFFSFVRNCYLASEKKYKIIIYLVSFIIYIIDTYYNTINDIDIIVKAICYFFIGNSIFLIYKYLSSINIKYIGMFLFIGYSVYFFFIYKYSFLNNNYLMPLSFAGFILTLKNKISNNKILSKLGIFSYQIYLIHFFVNYTFEMYFDFNYINGIISYILTVVISYYLSLLISKLSINKYIFGYK